MVGNKTNIGLAYIWQGRGGGGGQGKSNSLNYLGSGAKSIKSPVEKSNLLSNQIMKASMLTPTQEIQRECIEGSFYGCYGKTTPVLWTLVPLVTPRF